MGMWQWPGVFPQGAFALGEGPFFAGLASALLITTYDFWGYYNITFLGGEVVEPARNYSTGNFVVDRNCDGALSPDELCNPDRWYLGGRCWVRRESGQGQALVSSFMEMAYGGGVAGKVAAVLVMVTAFASVFFSFAGGTHGLPFCGGAGWEFFSRCLVDWRRGGSFLMCPLLYLGGGGDGLLLLLARRGSLRGWLC